MRSRPKRVAHPGCMGARRLWCVCPEGSESDPAQVFHSTCWSQGGLVLSGLLPFAPAASSELGAFPLLCSGGTLLCNFIGGTLCYYLEILNLGFRANVYFMLTRCQILGPGDAGTSTTWTYPQRACHSGQAADRRTQLKPG